MSQRIKIACKSCGKPVFVTAISQRLDVARNLSAPERCPDCRKKNREQINQTGQSYWVPKLELDDSKRCWGKYGLGRLDHNRPDPIVETYTGIPVELPLLAAKNPNDKSIPDEWRELANKFSKIAPIAQELVDKATAPNGPRVFVLVGPTGTGKSTWVPYRLLRSPIGENGRILVTQPRTITLRGEKGSQGPPGVPGFIASKLMGIKQNWTGAGQEVGLQYSGVYDQKDTYTKLFFTTDGTLINMIRSGDIGNFSMVMIDEAHEQSRNMELIFALLKYRMPLYPHLKLLIASATIDIDKFAKYFGGGSLGNVCLIPSDRQLAISAGTLKPIFDRFISGSVDDKEQSASGLDYGSKLPAVERLVGKPAKDRLRLIPESVSAVVQAICDMNGFTKLKIPNGDILVFLPRIEDVENTSKELKRLNLDLNVFECHAQVESFAAYDNSDRQAAKAMAKGEPTRPQRVVLATNYAETSVTMSNLRYVIDSGMIVQQGWDPVTCSVAYRTDWHSQAGCKQRKGRVGRVQEGECFRLYSKAEHDAMPKETPPEVSRIPLDTFFLEAKASGIEDLSTFDWLGKSTDATVEINRATEVLSRRGVLDVDGDITHRGVEFSGFQVNTVDLALCMSESDAFACTLEVATFLSFLQVGGNVFKKGDSGAIGYVQWCRGCFDDVELYLRLFHRWVTHPDRTDLQRRKAWFEEQGVNAEFLKEVESAREGLIRNISRRTHDSVTWRALDLKRLHRVRLLVARCLPEWIYIRDSVSGQFKPLSPEKCPCSELVRLDTNSACLLLNDIEAFVSIGRTRIGKAVVAQHVVRIDQKWVSRLNDSVVGLANLLRESMITEAGTATNAEKIVRSIPQSPKPLTYAKDQRLELRVVKRMAIEGGEESGGYLCEDKNGTPVVVDLDGVFTPGTPVQVITIEGGSMRRIKVTQGPLIEELKNLGKPIRAFVTRVASPPQMPTEVDGLYVRIDPFGVEGLLRKDGMGFKERASLLTLQVGSFVDVLIGSREGRQLRLMTDAMAKGIQRSLSPGQKFKGVVIDVNTYGQHHDRAGEVSGFFVEVVPGRFGFLRKGALGRFADQRVSLIRVGNEIDVEIETVPTRQSDDIVLRLPRILYAIEQRVNALVTGLADDTTGRGPPMAFFELSPLVVGVLHYTKAPKGFLNSIGVGASVIVTIVASRGENKRRETEYELRVS